MGQDRGLQKHLSDGMVSGSVWLRNKRKGLGAIPLLFSPYALLRNSYHLLFYSIKGSESESQNMLRFPQGCWKLYQEKSRKNAILPYTRQLPFHETSQRMEKILRSILKISSTVPQS